MFQAPRSSVGFTNYGNSGSGFQPIIPPGPENSVYWSNGIINDFTRNPILGDNSNRGSLIIRQDDIRNTQVPGLTLENPTVSTALLPEQESGTIWLRGSEWNSTLLVSQNMGIGLKLNTAQTSTTVGGKLQILADSNGVVSTIFQLTNAGEIEFTASGALIGNTGMLRTGYPNLFWVAVDSANVVSRLLSFGITGTDELRIGDSANNRCNLTLSNSQFLFYDGASPRFFISATALESFVSTIAFNKDVGAPATFGYIDSTTGAGQPTIIKGQGSTVPGNLPGGPVFIRSGNRTGLGFRGAIALQLNPNNIAFETLVELANVVSSNLVVSLCLGAQLSATEMPANTGSRVMFIANAAVNPSANPVGGGILYSNAGALTWRGPGGTVTVLGAA